MSRQTESIRQALLAAGTHPVLQVAPLDCTVLPTSTSNGYDVGESLVAFLKCSLRRDAGRVCTITVDTFDGSATYTCDLGAASTAVVASPADLGGLLSAWKTAIEALADADGDPIATAAIFDADGDGTDDSLRIVGLKPAGYRFAVSATGSAALALTLDPDSCTVDVYGALPSSAVPSSKVPDAEDLLQARSWDKIRGSSVMLDGSGDLVRIECAGLGSIRPHVHSIDGVTGDTTATGSGISSVTRRTVLCIMTPCQLGSA
jgi:hypothetical protein